LCGSTNKTAGWTDKHFINHLFWVNFWGKLFLELRWFAGKFFEMMDCETPKKVYQIIPRERTICPPQVRSIDKERMNLPNPSKKTFFMGVSGLQKFFLLRWAAVNRRRARQPEGKTNVKWARGRRRRPGS
jgi:hypothetical protein